MNWDVVKGNWLQAKGKMKEEWGKLTDDDWDVVEGDRDQLVGRLQERYGWARDEAEKRADAWAQAYRA
ncbi:MAG: CsbD family protein [Fimbriimonas sp.]